VTLRAGVVIAVEGSNALFHACPSCSPYGSPGEILVTQPTGVFVANCTGGGIGINICILTAASVQLHASKRLLSDTEGSCRLT
jgi:hypothetical protein